MRKAPKMVLEVRAPNYAKPLSQRWDTWHPGSRGIAGFTWLVAGSGVRVTDEEDLSQHSTPDLSSPTRLGLVGSATP